MSTDYVLNKLDELKASLEAEREARRELEREVKALKRFTGAEDWCKDLTKYAGHTVTDLAGHFVGLRGRVSHLEDQTGIDTEDMDDAELEELEGLTRQ